MTFSMKTYYVIAFLVLIQTDCFCQASQKLTWFSAQSKCREQNQTLTLKRNESENFFWTGFYERFSQWIKIIGCYNKSALRCTNFSETQLKIASPGLCQEICLEKNIFLFAVQAEKCFCLLNGFNYSQNQISSLECNNTCDNSTMLSTECGGQMAYNVYLTNLTDSTLDIQKPNNCLALQCASGSHLFLSRSCTESLKPICNNINLTEENNYGSWTKGLEYCRMNGSYPIGNVNLSDVNSACTDLSYTDPRWTGVVQDKYIGADHGQLIAETDHSLFVSCVKCRFKNGEVDCKNETCTRNINSDFHCSENVFSVTPLPETTETGDLTQPENTTYVAATKMRKESPVAQIVVPVVLVILLCICAVVVGIYIRRKKQLKAKDATGTHKSPTMNSECYSDIDNNISKNYFVLQKSNPSYELADHAKIESKVESPYNETEDGTYDHLGKKDARKQPVAAEDNYNHASTVMSQDLSDYDVANNKQVHEEDNDYDHASPAENSYDHFHTSQKQETDYSELF